MADIKISGTDTSTGQNKPVSAGDTIRPQSGDFNIAGSVPLTPTSNGSNVALNGGAGGSSSGDAGGITITGGTTISGGGGDISISGSSAVGGNNTGGSVAISSGSSQGNAGGGAGAPITITAGEGGATSTGSSITVTAGIGGSTSGSGGTLLVAAVRKESLFRETVIVCHVPGTQATDVVALEGVPVPSVREITIAAPNWASLPQNAYVLLFAPTDGPKVHDI